ncbi:hypothetical protein QUW15_11340 [Desulfovibrio piger]|nr:hypothetical protein [Desulfovibrio piger]
MGYKYCPYMFPAQMFPDVELGKVVLTENTLTISVNDSTLKETGEPASEWVLSKDAEEGFIYGDGDMIIFYEGPATLKWRNLHEKIWHEGGRDLLPRLTALDIIRREPNPPILEILSQEPDFSLALQFSNREEEEGFVLYIQLEKYTGFEWNGRVYDEYSDPDRR